MGYPLGRTSDIDSPGRTSDIGPLGGMSNTDTRAEYGIDTENARPSLIQLILLTSASNYSNSIYVHSSRMF